MAWGITFNTSLEKAGIWGRHQPEELGQGWGPEAREGGEAAAVQGDVHFMEKQLCRRELAAVAALVLPGGCSSTHPGPHGTQLTTLIQPWRSLHPPGGWGSSSVLTGQVTECADFSHVEKPMWGAACSFGLRTLDRHVKVHMSHQTP